jgi:Flp pilus assembly protein TadG
VSSPGVPARTRRDRESGQATVEFALILLPMMIVVAGIIYFGIGLNFWLDMNRLANQGARQAVVNNWPPQCPRDSVAGYNCNSSTVSTSCTSVMNTNSKARLQDVLRCQTRNGSQVTVCFSGKNPAGTGTAAPGIGDPVRVRLTAPYKFFFIGSFGITLKASATMRLEQVPMLSLKTGAGGPTCT